MYRALLYLVAGWSGCFVMAVELLGGRLLAPFFGSSIYVWGALIAVFMLALSLGYLLGGRCSLHAPTLRRLAALLWAAALALLPALLWGDAWLERLSAAIPDPRFGSLAAAALLFFVPCTISGMVSPYAVRLLVADASRSGEHAGKLYFVSTFGSALGTLLTSFYLVLWLEVNQILWIMIGISSAVALLAAVPPVRAVLPAVLLASVAWAPGPVRAEQQLLHQERSLYRQVLVYEDAGTRCLCFTRRCAIGRQSCQLQAEPQRLVFDYTRMMLGALLIGPAPRRVLIIGLGGGTLPDALARLLPAAQIDTVEIDPAVTRVARDYFGFRPDGRLQVHEEDGRAYVRRAAREGRHYDLVMLDAYDNEYIPEHLLTREFLTEVRGLLAPGAVLAANTFSSSRLYSNESVTYRAVFGDFYNLKAGNRVILARLGGLPDRSLIVANAKQWSQPMAELGVDTDQLLARFDTRADWDAGARVLTDQYSPANLLNR